MLDKYRLHIGLGLILAVFIGSAILLWQRKNYQDNTNQQIIAKDVEINNLQKQNQDLKDQIIQLTKNDQGLVAGVSTSNQSVKPQISSSQTIIPNQSVQSDLININTAGLSELDKLPGVGPTRAQQIIDYRNTNGLFQKPNDIMKVKGIGQATYDKMKGMIEI